MRCPAFVYGMISYDALFWGLSISNRYDLVLMESFQYLCPQRIGEGGPDFLPTSSFSRPIDCSVSSHTRLSLMSPSWS